MIDDVVYFLAPNLVPFVMNNYMYIHISLCGSTEKDPFPQQYCRLCALTLRAAVWTRVRLCAPRYNSGKETPATLY